MQQGVSIETEASETPPVVAQLETPDGLTFELAHDETIIGRALEADVVIGETDVSRMHASIERVGTRFQLLDLGSTNGTRWNGVRMAFDPVNLSDGDVIALGQHVYLTFKRAVPEPLTLSI